jgi:ribonuclease D
MFRTTISKEEINQLPVAEYSNNIVLLEEPREILEAVKEIRSLDVLGFDTETRPSFRKGRKNKIALLQLAGYENVWIFRLNQMGLPDELVDILTNPEIKKVGVAIRDDLKGLQVYKTFQPEGFIDLAKYSDNFSINDNGLRKLAAIILGVKISKSQQISNWEQKVLTEKQIRYAAIDAWACFEIYQQLNQIERES